MNLEKLGLMLLLNTFSQLGNVKNHLQTALKEVLLAIQATLDIATKSPPESLLGSNKEVISLLFTPVQKVLTYTIDKVSPPVTETSSSETPHLKNHIVDSIISAIDDEIENTLDTSSEKGKLKVEALMTVKQVLLQQTQKSSSIPAARSANVA